MDPNCDCCRREAEMAAQFAKMGGMVAQYGGPSKPMGPTAFADQILYSQQNSSPDYPEPNYPCPIDDSKDCGKSDVPESQDKERDDGNVPYEHVAEAAEFLLKCVEIAPKFGLICGFGLQGIADKIENPKTFPYDEIPNFPCVCDETGHIGEAVIGKLHGQHIIAFKAPFHCFEGLSMQQTVIPIRVMKCMKVKFVLISSFASSINPKLKVGDLMLIKDHVNFLGMAGVSPLRGINDERFGPRFPAMTNAYDPKIITLARTIAIDMGIKHIVHEGVFGCIGGPSFETAAEANALLQMGVDAVGMSIVHETIAARHSNLIVFGMSVITAKSPLDYEPRYSLTIDEVLQVAQARVPPIAEFITRLVCAIGCEDSKNLSMD